MRSKKAKEKENRVDPLPIPITAIVFLSIGIIAGIIHIISINSIAFAEFINNTAGAFLRFILAKVFDIFPFSFMEYLIICAPAIIAYTAYLIYRRAKRGKIFLIRSIASLLSIFAFVYSCFAIGFAPGYRGRTLSDKLSLERDTPTAEELYDTALIITNELWNICDHIDYSESGDSVYTKSLDALSEEISDCYKRLSEKYGFINTFDSNIKPIVLSKYMTYTHISGIYSFFTGEANLNTNYPDFINVYTTAHEMAHQRGISREDEANFIAFLVLLESEDPFLLYSAYLNMFSYLADALYDTDPALYRKIYAELHPKALGDLQAYSAFFEEYRDSTAAAVTDKLNDAYLESQGTEGTVSYGLVAELAVAYYKE